MTKSGAASHENFAFVDESQKTIKTTTENLEKLRKKFLLIF